MNLPGIADEEFIRDKVPMTKEEIRILTMCKAKIRPDNIIWDIGAGTGSLSIEAALLASQGEVYAIEKKDLASGKYKIVFEVKDGSNNNKSLELHIDNIATAPYITAPVGETTIVNTANGLNAVLQTGSSIDKIEVLSKDTIIGGAGDDIIFGDTILGRSHTTSIFADISS